jgi:hypothetical protein
VDALRLGKFLSKILVAKWTRLVLVFVALTFVVLIFVVFIFLLLQMVQHADIDEPKKLLHTLVFMHG